MFDEGHVYSVSSKRKGMKNGQQIVEGFQKVSSLHMWDLF